MHTGNLVGCEGIGAVIICVAHKVVEWCVLEAMESTHVTTSRGVTTDLVGWGRVGVVAEITRLKGWLRFHAWVAAGEDLRDPLKDVVEAQAVSYFMDHGVSVTSNAIEGRIQDNASQVHQGFFVPWKGGHASQLFFRGIGKEDVEMRRAIQVEPILQFFDI